MSSKNSWESLIIYRVSQKNIQFPNVQFSLIYIDFIPNIFYLSQYLSKCLLSVNRILNVFQDTLYFIHWSLVRSEVFKIQEGEVWTGRDPAELEIFAGIVTDREEESKPNDQTHKNSIQYTTSAGDHLNLLSIKSFLEDCLYMESRSSSYRE